MIEILEADSDQQIEKVRTLFLEYAASLDFDLSFQGFDTEIKELPNLYSPPTGNLFVALSENRMAGCVGVRYFGEGVCEMKRLYVRPEFRGLHTGRRLAERAVQEARVMGYRTMRLDTVPSMKRAEKLYRSLGFRPIPPYRHNPLEGAVFMEMDLTAD